MGLGVAMVSRGSLSTYKSLGVLRHPSDITLAQSQGFLSGHIYLCLKPCLMKQMFNENTLNEPCLKIKKVT